MRVDLPSVEMVHILNKFRFEKQFLNRVHDWMVLFWRELSWLRRRKNWVSLRLSQTLNLKSRTSAGYGK